MSSTTADRDYHCPTCESPDVDVFELTDSTHPQSPERVHVYCLDDGCGWVHRDLPVGVFEELIDDD